MSCVSKGSDATSAHCQAELEAVRSETKAAREEAARVRSSLQEDRARLLRELDEMKAKALAETEAAKAEAAQARKDADEAKAEAAAARYVFGSVKKKSVCCGSAEFIFTSGEMIVPAGERPRRCERKPRSYCKSLARMPMPHAGW